MLKVLRQLQVKREIIGDVRGRGLMMAVELVKDRKSKQPNPESMVKLFENTGKNGQVASKSGAYSNVLRICPPLCIQMQDIAFFEEAINDSFDNL